MDIREIGDQYTWESLLAECEEKTFLDSWNWSAFQQALGHSVWRLGVYDGEALIAGALVVKMEARRGDFLFVPHGPVLRTGNPKSEIRNPKQIINYKCEILKTLAEYLRELGKREGVAFVRIAPVWERTEGNQAVFTENGFREAPMHIHPEVTWELDTTQNEEDILMDMRKNTRNLVRRSQREEGLRVVDHTSEEGLQQFNELYRATAERHNFVPFSYDYLRKEFEIFSAEDQMRILLAEYNGDIIAGAIIVYWQNGGFYHHGASVHTHKKLPTSYLLQWEAIREAKRRGSEIYNFWGIAEEDTKSGSEHRFAGITRFKRGFGGSKRTYVKTQDLSLSWRYMLNYVVESVRKRRRHLD